MLQFGCENGEIPATPNGAVLTRGVVTQIR
jgi:hypothetical protein